MSLFHAYWLAVVVISILYAALLVWFLNGWVNIPYFTSCRKILNTKVSVVIPFFNEIETIESNIKSLLHQRIQTTEYEIICVDDHSTDGSAAIVKKYAEQYGRLHLLSNSEKGKKSALMDGIEAAKGELIVITDADCTYHENWLHSIVEYYEKEKPAMIIGPVTFKSGKGVFKKFQQIEFVSLVGTGAGAAGINHAVMCNAANLAFKKEVYSKLDDPFNINYTSGDDIFLMHNFKQQNEQIDFLKCKDAIVQTTSTKKLKDFINQRVRWSSKASGYKDADTIFTAGVVFLSSALMFISLLLLFKDVNYWKPLLFLYLVKTAVDTWYLYKTSDFFKVKHLLKWIPFFQVVYIFYVAIISLVSLFSMGKRHQIELKTSQKKRSN
ncbi:MAG: glycosyltransferase [Salinivirgaceae bacterium]|nr:glycosyltransferase [Salinivirgaceae bacterium]